MTAMSPKRSPQNITLPHRKSFANVPSRSCRTMHMWEKSILNILSYGIVTLRYFRQVSPETTFETTVCLCTHLTNFGSGFFVAPNPIDFDAAFKGFADIGSNPAIFATVITIFGLYFIGAIWARWKDKKDLEKVTCNNKQEAVLTLIWVNKT